MPFLLPLVALISEQPGSFVYHLVVIAWLMVASVNALSQWGRARTPTAARAAWAALSLFTLHFTYFLAVSLASASLLDAQLILPPLDRAINAASILVILWCVNFPEPSRPGDAFSALLFLLIGIALGASLWMWAAQLAIPPQQPYNGGPETPWEIGKMALLGLGLLLLIVRRRAQWPLGLVVMSLLFLGHILHFAFSPLFAIESDIPGIERFADLLALPLLAALLVRRSLIPAALPIANPLDALEDTAPRPTVAPEAAPRKMAVDAKAAVALASLHATADPAELAELITLALAHAFNAEMCLWLDAPDRPGGPQLAGAYDLAAEQFLPARLILLSEMPHVAAALKLTGLTQLMPDAHPADLRQIARAVGREPNTPALIAPLRHEDGPALGALILLTPQRIWSNDEQNLLTALAEAFAAALHSAPQLNQQREELARLSAQSAEAQHTQTAAQAHLAQLTADLFAVQAEAQRLMAELGQAKEESNRQRLVIEDLTFQLHTRQQVEASHTALMGEVNELRTKLLQAQHEAEERQRVENELDAALERIEAFAVFEQRLEEAQREANEYREQERQLREDLKQARADWAARETEIAAKAAPLGAEAAAQVEAAHAHEQQLQLELYRLNSELAEARAMQAPYLAAQAALADAHEQLAQTQQELESARAAQAALAEAEAQLTSARIEAAETAAQLSNAHEQMAQLRGELELRANELARAQTVEAELARAQTELGEVNAKWVAAQTQQSETATQIIAAQEQEAELRQALARAHQGFQQQAQAAAETLAATQDKLAASQTELETATQLTAQLQQEAEQLHADLAEAQTWNTALIATQSALDEAAANLALAQDQAHEQQTALETLRAELAQVQNAAATLGAVQTELSATAAQLAEAQTREAQTQTELESLRAQRPAPQLQEEVDSLRVELSRAVSQRMSYAVQLDDRTRALAAIQAELLERTEELDALRAKWEDHKRAAAHWQGDFDKVQTRPLPKLIQPEAPPPPTLPPGVSINGDREVVNSLSQELRQPMSSISGYTDLLLSESVGILGALQRKFLERIKASTERMGALLDDLIHVTALDAGALALTHESLDVTNTLEEAVQACEAQFRERGVELILDITADLPRLNADHDALRQIFTHLLHNAAAVSPANSEVVLTVRRETEPGQHIGPPNHYLLIAVRDAGGGIAPEDQSRVFSRLYRADAALVAGVGDTGVGLSMVKALVEAHGGRIWVTSQSGTGSTFFVLLPLNNVAPKNGHNGSPP